MQMYGAAMTTRQLSRTQTDELCTKGALSATESHGGPHKA